MRLPNSSQPYSPQPYKLSVGSRTYYREPGYLLCTDLTSAAQDLIQIYVDRWQIEVNHRDEKSLMGVGDAQVRALRSVPRHPAFGVACYSLLLLAGLREFGPGWRPEHFPLPRWRKKIPLRASALDLLTRLRADLHETCDSRYRLERNQGKFDASCPHLSARTSKPQAPASSRCLEFGHLPRRGATR